MSLSLSQPPISQQRVPITHQAWSWPRRFWWSFQSLLTVAKLLPLIFASLVYLGLWSLGRQLTGKKKATLAPYPQYSSQI
ncbi:hypothetical protein [Synechococcus sp. PCC 6312]|uniref:hypothetical protein n=1 Tax=Synechococcus sp. (strain ATCC 27167 / PCC 6312) TaxID=195253 RepID=UPI00029ED597|nr:hypothetical protein [Synechococcus sp. PCC 6312]AFY61307.1 hypothetical protein Syn6312_2190 [Synechococcus sp. PCC 6312]